MAMLHVLVLLTSFWVLKFLWASSDRSSPAGCGLCPCNKGKDNLVYNKRHSKSRYRSFVTFRSVMNPVELADGPIVYVTSHGEGNCLVASANQLSVSLYQRLAPSLPHENSAGQKLRGWIHTNCALNVLIRIALTERSDWTESVETLGVRERGE
jgi:hypothetical protein